MPRKLQIFLVVLSLAASVPFATCGELPISKKLTLSDVLRLGFRPSSMLPDNFGMLRCWEKQEIVLKFENGFEYPIKAEDITFEVYDDDQISSASITGDRDHPLRLDEAVKNAGFIFGKVGTVPPELVEWSAKVKKERMFTIFGHLVKAGDGIRVGVELLPTLQKINQKPALLGLILEWEYLGSDPLGGSRSKPVTTPPGFDWDMSYEAWSKRIIDKGTRGPAKVPKMDGSPLQGGKDRQSPVTAPAEVGQSSFRFWWVLIGGFVLLIAAIIIGLNLRKKE